MHRLLTTNADLARDWSRLLVFFGGTAWDGNRFPDQHMAERLVRYTPVMYVDPPISAARALAGGGPRAVRPRLSQLQENLLRLTPVAPPLPQRWAIRPLTKAITRRTTESALAALGTRADIVVVGGLTPSLRLIPAGRRVLYGTDDFVAGAHLMGLSQSWLEKLERDQVSAADLVVAVSDVLLHKWSSYGANVALVENGCDDRLFGGSDSAPLPTDVHLEPPIAGFIGHLSDRIDLDLLEAVAAEGHSLLLVGPRQRTFAVQRVTRLLDRPNVQWVGPKPFSELPSYLRLMAVGLVPYSDTAFNRASFPLKTMEYLSAGRQAVVTDLPAMHRLPPDVVRMATTPDDFASAVAAALRTPVDPVADARRRTVASEHGWDARAEELARLLRLPEPVRAAEP